MASTPEEKQRRRFRIKSHIARDLGTTKYRQRVKEDGKKKVQIKDITHAELIKLIQENESDIYEV